MKIPIFLITFTVCLLNLAYGSDIHYAALDFAKEYANEIESQRQSTAEKSGIWKIDMNVKGGRAKYEEKERTLRSDWDAFYYEVAASLIRQSENDVETALDFSYGQSAEEKETWYISNIEYQTNDLDFSRIKFRGSVGKILYSDRYKNLRVVPFLGYGFRRIDFKRANFNILNTITSRKVVTEKYYIHHLDVGIKWDSKIGEKWGISGLGSFGYAVYNKANNSKLGGINGGGGTLADGNINLQYSFDNFWQLIFGGFVELQDLKGGEKDGIIWPDNKLNIYGGNIGIRCLF